MSDTDHEIDREIQDIVERITILVHGAYARGKTDAIERMVRAAQSDHDPGGKVSVSVAGNDAAEREPRKRAPKGAVDTLIDRVLADNSGKTPDEIRAQAADDGERMIAVASIRARLRAGLKAERYRKEGNRWYATRPWEREGAGESDSDAALWAKPEERSLMPP